MTRLRQPRGARGPSTKPTSTAPSRTSAPTALLFFPDLERPALAFGFVTPNWFATVMGTGIVAVAASSLPYQPEGLHTAAIAVWAFAALLLVVMPVVPPMVSASAGALLVPHASAGDVRVALLVGCYAMFVGAALASAVVIARIWRKLLVHGIGAAATVPTLWIVLGPLGQSVTAANLLGGVAHQALPPGVAHVLQVAGIVYGIPVWSVAVVWAGFAAVGMVVTGTSGLALHTGSTVFAVLAAVFYVGLVGAWLVVATRTTRAAARGAVFLPT